MNRQSKRFNPSRLAERLIPLVLLLLFLALLASLLLVTLSVTGIFHP